MTDIKAKSDFKSGKNCTQIVLDECCSDIISKKMSKELSSCFAGGMCAGKICGAVTGAYMVLGLKNRPELKNEFDREFLKEFKSLECKEILGFDLSKDDELKQIQKQDLFMKICHKTVKFAVDFLKKNGV
ncbi:C-GCAxxG-C-C family protein [Campylobacter corcagiensis]|uniref:C_GCAxxG_C_C family protein n=1 Tax=Campylobacter corcagiensis TaxID=1448857 RepID=A0A7M1LES7_9BACT|nr:C-GCAxxG-C-C family protein [Campylobacter corcagiensis]QKF64754.1 C_GCAxxG_C_C family protein [Campylobacter corcagiensis]QOQ87082.1 C_GCAxxG_C_C family protein [Campylobacter corcagiensis]